MAITISDLANLAFNGNPISVVFTSDSVAENTTIEFGNQYSTPSNSSVIKIFFDKESIEIVYLFTTWNDFFLYLSQHFIIKRYFAVSSAGDKITLTSFKKESLNALVIVDSDFSPATVVVSEGGIDKISVLLGVNIWNGTAFLPSNFDKSHTVQLDSKAYFNIAEAFVFAAMEINEAALISFAPFFGNSIAYQLEYAERTADGLASATTTSNDFFVINGRFNQAYLGTAIVSENFLTASERHLFNKDNEPRFLSLIASDDFTSVVLKIKAYDFSDSDFDIEKTLVNIDKGQILNIPIGYNILGLNASANGPFYKYEVLVEYVADSETLETETFYIDCNRQTDLNYETFLFLNSRGGIDTLSFTGESEQTTAFDSLQYNRSKTSGLNEMRTEQHRIQSSAKQYSGFYDDIRAFNYIEELLNSEAVWKWENGQLKKIVIENTSFEKGSVHEGVFDMDFEYSFAVDAVASDIDYVNVGVLAIESISTNAPNTISYDEPD